VGTLLLRGVVSEELAQLTKSAAVLVVGCRLREAAIRLWCS
jgi:hypothetical protein